MIHVSYHLSSQICLNLYALLQITLKIQCLRQFLIDSFTPLKLGTFIDKREYEKRYQVQIIIFVRGTTPHGHSEETMLLYSFAFYSSGLHCSPPQFADQETLLRILSVPAYTLQHQTCLSQKVDKMIFMPLFLSTQQEGYGQRRRVVVMCLRHIYSTSTYQPLHINTKSHLQMKVFFFFGYYHIHFLRQPLGYNGVVEQ